MRLVERPSMRRWRNVAVQRERVFENTKTNKSPLLWYVMIFMDTTAITGLRGEYYVAWKLWGKLAYHAADDRGKEQSNASARMSGR
jgi:hypothetical protein